MTAADAPDPPGAPAPARPAGPAAMWDDRYGQDGFAYGDAPNDFLVEQAAALPPGPVLELAAGEGRNGVWLAGRGHDVTLVDVSAVGLEKARALAASRGLRVRTVPCDLGAYDVEPGAWSAIVSIWAHLPRPVRARLHAACVAGLRPGGVFLLEAYTPAQVALGTGGPPDPALCMTLDALRAELAGLELVVAVERERDVSEGRYHRGRSAVVQVLARKPG